MLHHLTGGVAGKRFPPELPARGHLEVGQSHESASMEETKQELGIETLDSRPVFVGYEGYDTTEDTNRERRSWSVKLLSQREYDIILKRREDAQENKKRGSKKDYKKTLFDEQKEGKGKGEVFDTYDLTFEKIEREKK